MSTQELYDIFFTGAENPRHGCIMIGWVGQKPIYLEFETPEIPTSETRTTIYRNGKQPAAHFEWTMGTHMGMATIGGRRIPMADFVQPGGDNSSRLFRTTDGRNYIWRKATNQRGSYELFPGPGSRPIARFSRFPQPQTTPIGPSHALLQCDFDDDVLLLNAALALCLNRWIDLHGL